MTVQIFLLVKSTNILPNNFVEIQRLWDEIGRSCNLWALQYN